MNLPAFFLRRPTGTVLLTIGLAVAGILAWFQLPVAPLPDIDFPTINVTAMMPGASPETMGSSVAEPLEKHFRAISGLTEMTSRSNTGLTQVTLQFDLARKADSAARDVQAAINAARGDLPLALKANPTYRKINPAAAPILILSLTSSTRSPAQIYDAVSGEVQQRLLQVPGVGDVQLAGASLPALRVEPDLDALSQRGIALEDLRTALQSSQAMRPKGVIETSDTSWLIETPGARLRASDFTDLVVAWRNGAAVRLRDVAHVREGVEDTHTAGYFNGKRSLDIIVSRQPGANIIATIDGVKAQLPGLRAALARDVTLSVASDLSTTIRASLHEVEITLVIAVLLVIAVVGLFLGSWRATMVPALATLVSLLGTLAVMDLAGFNLDNLSLMALTVATGFVVDDAIVVVENIERHLEAGLSPYEACLRGAQEVAFTVVAISLSLVAVFLPILFMGGLPGRLFNEFAITMTAAVLISLVLSLTTTPVLAALLLRPRRDSPSPSAFARIWSRIEAGYARLLDLALARRRSVLMLFAAAFALQFALLVHLPKGLFPDEDTGSILGAVRTDEAMSFQALDARLQRVAAILRRDPGVENVVAFTGGRMIGGGFLFVTLKPQGQRDGVRTILTRLHPKLARVEGMTTFLNPVQDLRAGGRQSNATYQYTLSSNDTAALGKSADALMTALKKQPLLTDLDNDRSARAASSRILIDRDRASLLGVTARAIDQTLYDAFGQRQVAIIPSGLNQYHVVMAVPEGQAASPGALRSIRVPVGNLAGKSVPTGTSLRDAAGGSAIVTTPAKTVPLDAFATWSDIATSSQVNHEDGLPSATISFNLAPGASLGAASKVIEGEARRLGIHGAAGTSTAVRGAFSGTAKLMHSSLASLPWLVLLAIAVIYIVLGILYEDWIHPLTVLSTLPPAGLGAMAALAIAGMQFDLIAAIGILLLIGIVKKNAILIIDFALEAERTRGLSPREAIREASLLRLRPIVMTSLAAALGALPLAIGFGTGSELRQPLGLAIFGGLVVSQFLTLFTTPVIYLLLDGLHRKKALA